MRVCNGIYSPYLIFLCSSSPSSLHFTVLSLFFSQRSLFPPNLQFLLPGPLALFSLPFPFLPHLLYIPLLSTLSFNLRARPALLISLHPPAVLFPLLTFSLHWSDRTRILNTEYFCWVGARAVVESCLWNIWCSGCLYCDGGGEIRLLDISRGFGVRRERSGRC